MSRPHDQDDRRLPSELEDPRQHTQHEPNICCGTQVLTQTACSELRIVASRFLGNRPHTLQATAVVHEAWIRLERSGVKLNDRGHLLAMASTVIRQVLIDHARRKQTEKRGGNRARISFDERVAHDPSRPTASDLLKVHEALSEFSQFGPRQAQVVEMKFFGGLSVAEIADALGISQRTVANDWAAARAWLRDYFAN